MKQTTNMSRVIGEIQSIARKINKDWFDNELDMERVIFSTTSTPRVYGHFTPYLSYRIHDKATGERGAVEINISSATIDSRPIEFVISTMIHEMTHYYNWCHGVKDCSRQGQYHSKKFKLEAEKHGLHIDYDSRIGWSITEPTEELIEWVIENGFEDFRLGRNEFQQAIIGIGGQSGTPPKFPKKSNSIKMICPCCGNIARVTKTTNLICGDCMMNMIEV